MKLRRLKHRWRRPKFKATPAQIEFLIREMEEELSKGTYL